jgi:hypothetical protein
MSITLQLKSIERRLGVLLSSDSYVLQSSNAGDGRKWGFEGLCRLLIGYIEKNKPDFKPVAGTLELTASIGGINYWFRFMKAGFPRTSSRFFNNLERLMDLKDQGHRSSIVVADLLVLKSWNTSHNGLQHCAQPFK